MPRGRPKGSKNQNPHGRADAVTARVAVLEVFKKLGGIKHMTDWAAKDPNEFYKLFARLIPLEMDIGGGNVQFVMNRIIEAPQGRLFEHDQDAMPGINELAAEYSHQQPDLQPGL